jgi:hypothetical protein
MKRQHKQQRDARTRRQEQVRRVNLLLDLVSANEIGRLDLCQDLMFSSMKKQ